MRKIGLAAVLGLSLAACSSGQESLDSVDETIVRATSNGGRNEVVLIQAVIFDGATGSFITRSCSGAYFAPRVVATAAHCLDADPAQGQSVLQVIAYYGDNFATDVALLPPPNPTYVVPKPGQPSTFAVADSFETHPAWDRTQKYPDLGIVYLDRKLPFDPLPLARFPLDKTWLNREVTISGWGANVATGPTTATGGRVQRTGRTRLLGSPTAADYHPEDPNPGLLVPANRAKIIKIDGRAPYSNGCFGDSGSPLLVSQWGQTYIAGIEYFGGLFCEDYSLYTRIDPFLPFFDEAYRKGGQAVVTPSFDCVTANSDGSLTAFFGYQNQNGVNVTVPFGVKNTLALDTGGLRPTLFKHGTHHFVFGVDFTPAQTVSWKLSPENSPTTTLTVNKKRVAAAPPISRPRCARSRVEPSCAPVAPACNRTKVASVAAPASTRSSRRPSATRSSISGTPASRARRREPPIGSASPRAAPAPATGRPMPPPAPRSSTRSSSVLSAASLPKALC